MSCSLEPNSKPGCTGSPHTALETAITIRYLAISEGAGCNTSKEACGTQCWASALAGHIGEAPGGGHPHLVAGMLFRTGGRWQEGREGMELGRGWSDQRVNWAQEGGRDSGRICCQILYPLRSHRTQHRSPRFCASSTGADPSRSIRAAGVLHRVRDPMVPCLEESSDGCSGPGWYSGKHFGTWPHGPRAGEPIW